MHTIRVTDLYHAAYLAANGCDLVDIECQLFMDKVVCTLIFSGENLDELTTSFMKRDACMNLYTFRMAYTNISECVNNAKRSYKDSQKQRASQGGRL
jgi:hypothetical protein